jgi:single-strand DNA-binding protein
MTRTRERTAPPAHTTPTAAKAAKAAEAEDVNEVRIAGRVSGEVAEKVLPSGDLLVGFRVVARRPGPGPTRVDTIEVSARSSRARTAAGRLAHGDRVEVEGALRRRFFRGGGGPTSRYEVEAVAVRRLRRAGSGRR